jgi:hypothetical protein
MAANTKPIFTLTANKGINTGLRLTTANTTRDLSTTTNGGLLFSGGTNGSRIESIDFLHVSSAQTQASVACVGRVFLCDSAIGGNPRLIREIVMGAVTPSAIAIGAVYTISFTTPLFIPSGEFLWATISATQTSGAYNITCNGGDY